jgi:hypothetical protein
VANIGAVFGAARLARSWMRSSHCWSRVQQSPVWITVARFFQTFPAKVAGKFKKIWPLQKTLCKATFQTPFVKPFTHLLSFFGRKFGHLAELLWILPY